MINCYLEKKYVSDEVAFLICVGGIYISYFIFGVLQEEL